MNKYLHQDYLYHSKKNNSEINSTINQKINDLTDGLIASILVIVSEILMLLGLICLILFFNQLRSFLILIGLFSIGIITLKYLQFS